MATNTNQIKRSALVYVKDIGEGAFSDVYQMTWDSPNGPIDVAAKKLHKKDTHELEILSDLDHPNIVKLIGVVNENTDFMLILELCKGGSLRSYLKARNGKHLPGEQFLDWAEQVAKPLEYLREKKLVHKDVKSPNYLVTSQNTLKLGDFGIAKNIDQTIEDATTTASYRWMAPELLVKGILSPKFDIFALAVVLWELWTVQYPWEGIQSPTIVYKVCNENERLPIPEDCPEPFKDLLRQCWQTDWKQRPDIMQVVKEIRAAAATAVDVRQGRITAGPWSMMRDFGTQDRPGPSGDSSASLSQSSAENLSEFQRLSLTEESAGSSEGTSLGSSTDHSVGPSVGTPIRYSTSPSTRVHQWSRVTKSGQKVVKKVVRPPKQATDNQMDHSAEASTGQSARAQKIKSFAAAQSLDPSALELIQRQIIAGPWNMVRKFGEDGPGKLRGAYHMTLSPDGDVVIADWSASQIRIYSIGGEHKSSINTHIRQSAVSSDNTCFMIDGWQSITMYELSGKYKGSWASSCPVASSSTPQLRGLAIDHAGDLLLGDRKNNYLYKHHQNGAHVASIKVGIEPWHIAVTSKGTIVIAAYVGIAPQVISNTGQVLHTLKHPVDESSWDPFVVYCHASIIFVSDGEHNSKILCYSESGRYLGSMPIPDIYPYGIAITPDNKTLLVCENKSVKVYTNPSVQH